MLQRLLGGGNSPLKKLFSASSCNYDERDACCVVSRDGEFVLDKTIIDEKGEGVKVIRSPGGTQGVLVQPDALQPKPGFGQMRFQVSQGDAVDPNALSGSHSVDLWTKASYQGQFLDGKFHGSGVYQFSDGRCYEGQFDKGNISGQGKFMWPVKPGQYSRPTSPASSTGSSQALPSDSYDGYAVFEGVFLDNEPVEGTLTMPDETGFKGPVKEVFGKRQGLANPPHYSPRTSMSSEDVVRRKTMTRKDMRRTTTGSGMSHRPSFLEYFANGMSYSELPPARTQTREGEKQKRPSLRI
jgi:hypothetical protein